MSAVQERVLAQFSTLTEQQKYDLILQMIRRTGVPQIRRLYSRMKELLSFDIISHLPPELVEKVFCYLDATSLCAAAQCCQKWRFMANSDTLWYVLCKQKNYLRFEGLPPPQEFCRPTSPKHQSYVLPKVLRAGTWKQVYMYASVLNLHWKEGIYGVAPLLRGHKRPVTSIACDGELLVSGSGDNTARIWSLASLECQRVLEGHSDSVNCIDVQDSVIVTGCADGLVRVFESRTGQCVQTLHGHSGSVDHIAIDGRAIVSTCSDCSIRVWDILSGKCEHVLTGHTDEIECIQLCVTMLLSGSWDHTLRLWDVSSGICKHVLQGHTEVAYCCKIINGRVVSGGGDGLVKVWEVDTGLLNATLTGHKQEVLCLACSEELIASGSADSTVRIWNFTGFCMHILEGHIGNVRCLHLEGRRLVSGGDRKRIVVWDVHSGSLLHTVHRQQTLLHRMYVTETKIITASPDSPGTISVIEYW